jgi:uroporphyrinogen-III decarboxylase
LIHEISLPPSQPDHLHNNVSHKLFSHLEVENPSIKIIEFGKNFTKNLKKIKSKSVNSIDAIEMNLEEEKLENIGRITEKTGKKKKFLTNQINPIDPIVANQLQVFYN